MRYNALAFLNDLFSDSDPTPDELPSEWRAMYAARTAAHVAHGRHREHAEHFALREVLAHVQQKTAPVSS
jgi:hypothetical protein